MSNVIQFLEAMGKTSAARFSDAEYAAAIAALDVDDAQRQALLTRDHVAINDLLGGRAKLMMLTLFPADDDEKPQDEQPDSEQPEKETPPESD